MKVQAGDRKFRFRAPLALGLLIGMVGGTSVLAKTTKHPGDDPAATATATDAQPKAQAEPVKDQSVSVTPVRIGPLRDVPPIQWWEAPESDHPEPVLVEGPKDTGPVDPSTLQSIPGPVASAPTPTGVSWDGVGVGLSTFAPNSNPPDVNGRVGATQYVQWNNTSFAVFNKNTGALLYGPAAGNTLFQALGGPCATHNDGDPVVAYDILAGRWILSQFVVSATPSASHQCIAVSATQDATGAYYLYDFVTDATNFIDYPKIGVWPDGYYMSAHRYNAAGTSFLGGEVFVFERTQMIQGLTARMQVNNLGASHFGFLPADLDSLTPPPTGEAEFLVGPGSTATTLAVSRVAVTWGATPTITVNNSTIPISSAGTPPCAGGGRICVPQPSPALSTDALDNLSNHMMYRLAYRNFGGSPVQESLVATSLGLGSTPTPTHGVIRWYELRNAGASNTFPSVFQFSSFNPDSSYRWMSSAAMDNSHDIAIGYSKSSSSIFPSIWINGRLGTDTVNTLGTEVQVQAGSGVQQVVGTVDPGNRWGDYSAMTLDPVDQCTFYYTNEYLKSNGGFNWSTRVAAYKFPSCTPAAAWGTVTGTITSCATGAPVSGVVVALSNGFAAPSDASGVYSILVPAGSYTASAADAARNCASASPVSVAVNPTSGGTATQNFCMAGTSKLEAFGLTVDDSSGNANGVINSNECFSVNLGVKNNGCGTETAIAATLTTSTPGVTIVQGSANYPDLAIDASNAQPFKIQTANTFLCGTTISFSLNLTYAGGTKTLAYTVHTCDGGPSQTIPASSIALSDPSQPDRLGRNQLQSPCSGKTCPGPINTAGTRNYKTYTFTNASGSAECFTVTINAALGGAGDIQAAAYQGSYTPPTAQGDASGNLCLNYLGDSGLTGLGTTVSSAAFSFTVAPQSNFVVVVGTSTGSTTSSVFSGTVSGFVSQTPGPGACSSTCSGQPNGTACNDGNACTQTDTCQNGACVGSNPVTCTASDQCHVAGTCNPSTGTCSNPNANDGTGCSDGNACTQTDKCVSGVCTGTNPVTCTASDQCHVAGTCSTTTGVCSNPAAPNGTACNDGNACTQADTCQGGACTGGTPLTCTDLNVCTDDTCSTTTGCVFTPAPGRACDDGNACTTNDSCTGTGLCAGGPALVCNDNDPCTDDSCVPGTGCVYTANTSPCDDGNACTVGDVCGGGVCHPGGPKNCDDNNVCTDDTCVAATGCVHTPLNCDDSNVCTNDSCSPGGGNSVATLFIGHDVSQLERQYQKNGTFVQTWGAAGRATGAAVDGSGVVYVCNPAYGNNVIEKRGPGNVSLGSITATVNGQWIEDMGNFGGGYILAGTFEGNVFKIDTTTGAHTLLFSTGQNFVGVTYDGTNIWTTGGFTTTLVYKRDLAGNVLATFDTSQTNGGIGYDPDDGTLWIGHIGGQVTHHSQAGALLGGFNTSAGGYFLDGVELGVLPLPAGCQHTAVDCDDFDPCTDDACDPVTGCFHTPHVCDDGNTCTDDACVPETGCVYTNNTAACDDGNVCTTGDTCSGGLCQAGSGSLSCTDNNPCTDDTCNPRSGCVFTNNTNPCDDGNPCTTGDVCGGGACEPGAGALNCNDDNVCTTDSCNPATGCVHTNNTNACDDGNPCTVEDTCLGGTCHGGVPLSCNDNNPCTTDTCLPGVGCVHTNNTDACDDGNACTAGDTCSGGVCNPGTPVVCDDGNACTTDSCSPASGCVFTNNQNPCNDGNACTVEDTCLGGTCHGGVPLSCNDNNVCTTDSCDPATGCVHTNNTNACDDGNACTQGDTCQGGTCVSGGPVICAAPDQCHLAGTCNPFTGGCSNPAKPNGTACNDGDPCTVGDRCVNGACSGAATITAPVETQGVTASADKSTFSWSADSSATSYDAVRGGSGAFPVGPGGGDETCFGSLADSALVDASNPAPGAGFWYLARARNGCGAGPWGTASNGTARITTTCP